MAGIDTEQRIAQRNKNFLTQEKESHQKTSEKFSIELRKNKRMEAWNKCRRKNFLNAGKIENFQEILEKVLNLKPGEGSESVLESLKHSFKEPEKKLVNENHLGVLVNALKCESEENQNRILDFLINFTFSCAELNEYLVKIGIYQVVSGFFILVEREICKNAVWLVTNLVNLSKDLKARVLNRGFLASLLEMLKIQRLPTESLEIVLWSFSTFGEYVCRLNGENLEELISILTTYTVHSNPELSYFSTHTLFNIISAKEKHLGQVLTLNISQPLIQNLSETPYKVKYMRLKLLGLILSNNSDTYTDTLLSQNLLPQLFNCLSNEHEKIRTESFFCFSNIAAGTLQQRSNLINKPMLNTCISYLTDQLSVSQEACEVLRILSFNQTPAHYEQILNDGVLHYLIETLNQTLNIYPHTRRLFAFIEQVLINNPEENLQVLQSSGFFVQLAELETEKNCEFSLGFKRFLDNWTN